MVGRCLVFGVMAGDSPSGGYAVREGLRQRVRTFALADDGRATVGAEMFQLPMNTGISTSLQWGRAHRLAPPGKIKLGCDLVLVKPCPGMVTPPARQSPCLSRPERIGYSFWGKCNVSVTQSRFGAIEAAFYL